MGHASSSSSSSSSLGPQPQHSLRFMRACLICNLGLRSLCRRFSSFSLSFHFPSTWIHLTSFWSAKIPKLLLLSVGRGGNETKFAAKYQILPILILDDLERHLAGALLLLYCRAGMLLNWRGWRGLALHVNCQPGP